MALKLVGSFSDADYPYLVTVDPHEQNKMLGEYYFDGHDPAPVKASETKIHNALYLANVHDYYLFYDGGKFSLHLKTQDEIQDVIIALSPKPVLVQTIGLEERVISPRLLKKRCRAATECLEKTVLRGRFAITALPEINGLTITTHDKPAYFALKRLAPHEYILGIETL